MHDSILFTCTSTSTRRAPCTFYVHSSFTLLLFSLFQKLWKCWVLVLFAWRYAVSILSLVLVALKRPHLLLKYCLEMWLLPIDAANSARNMVVMLCNLPLWCEAIITIVLLVVENLRKGSLRGKCWKHWSSIAMGHVCTSFHHIHPVFIAVQRERTMTAITRFAEPSSIRTGYSVLPTSNVPLVLHRRKKENHHHHHLFPFNCWSLCRSEWASSSKEDPLRTNNKTTQKSCDRGVMVSAVWHCAFCSAQLTADTLLLLGSPLF